MIQNPKVPPPEEYARARVWIFIFLGLGLFLFGPVYFGIRSHWPKEVRQKLAALERKGIPITLASVQERLYPLIPEAENGAMRCRDAFAHLQAPEWQWGFLQDPTQAPGEEELGRMRQVVEENQEALRLLRQARGFGRARFPIDLTLGYATLLPHLPKLKSGADILVMEALVHAAGNQPEEAMASLRACVHLAKLLEPEPLMISHLVRMTILWRASLGLEWILNWSETSLESLEDFRSEWSSFLKEGPFRRALIAERAEGLTLLRGGNRELVDFMMYSQWDEDGEMESPASRSGVWFGIEMMRVKGILQRDCLFFLNFHERVERALERPPQEWIELIGELEEAMEEARFFNQDEPFQVKIISGMLLPGVLKFLEREVQYQAFLRVTYTGLGLELERRGSVAETGEGAAGMEIDPYSGEPLMVRRQPGGCLVYSIGANRRDDFGRKSPNKSAKEDDISFRVGWKE